MSWFVGGATAAERKALAWAAFAFVARTALFGAAVCLLGWVHGLAQDPVARSHIVLACIFGALCGALLTRGRKLLGWSAYLACASVALAALAEGAFAMVAWLAIGAALELSIGSAARSPRRQLLESPGDDAAGEARSEAAKSSARRRGRAVL